MDTSNERGCRAMKTSKEIFAENLRDMLITKNKKQSDLAKFCGTTEATASRWVNGESMPRADMLDKICNYLRCMPDDLLKDKNKVVEMAPEDVLAEELHNNSRLFRLMYYASRLSDEQLDSLISIVGGMK